MLEQIERALCEANGCVWDLDPVSESRQQWRRDVAIVTSAIFAELETPSEEMVEGAARAITKAHWPSLSDVEVDDMWDLHLLTVKTSLAAAAAHLKDQ